MSESQLPKEPKTSAGVAGAGGGTLVAAIASSLPDESGLKTYLLLAAPAVAITLSGVWLWANVKISNWLRDREVTSVLNTARKTLQDALDNPNTTKGHQTNLRKELEKIELIALGRHVKRIESIKIFTEDDIQQSGT